MPRSTSASDSNPGLELANAKSGSSMDTGARHVEVTQDMAFPVIDPEERRVVRKLDMVIMPLMILVYFFQYISILIPWSPIILAGNSFCNRIRQIFFQSSRHIRASRRPRAHWSRVLLGRVSFLCWTACRRRTSNVFTVTASHHADCRCHCSYLWRSKHVHGYSELF